MLPARTYSVTIKRDWRALYEQIWQPAFFAQWASGMSESHLHQNGDDWAGEGAEGPIRVRFTPHNEYGVMDHVVTPAGGDEIHIPLRVIRNGDGAEVMLTLFRQPEMDDEKFAADAKWITKDLRALRDLAEGRPSPPKR